MVTGGAVVPSGRDEIFGRAEYLRGVAGRGVTPRDVVVWLPLEFLYGPKTSSSTLRSPA